MRAGIDRLLAGEADHLRGAACGLIVHPASVVSDLTFSADALLGAGFDVRALFGPQHGARGEKQDNMIESEYYADPVTGLPVHSLYGETRKPTPEMLDGLDALLFDLQDVGVRVFTFVWTMALSMEACAEAGVRFVVLDRPNPIGCHRREGPVLRAGFESFVGLHPVPLRHGLTCAELARWLNDVRGIACELEVIACEGLRRRMRWSDTGLPWVRPSPNLPTLGSCEVYPGTVLVEGTNLSEGRGTTQPFEFVGAPYLDARAFVERLDGHAPPTWGAVSALPLRADVPKTRRHHLRRCATPRHGCREVPAGTNLGGDTQRRERAGSGSIRVEESALRVRRDNRAHRHSLGALWVAHGCGRGRYCG